MRGVKTVTAIIDEGVMRIVVAGIDVITMVANGMKMMNGPHGDLVNGASLGDIIVK